MANFYPLQIHMLHDDISRIQLELVPMIQEIVTEWLIIHFFSTTPSESPALEDFSSQLSSLQIGRFMLWSAIKMPLFSASVGYTDTLI